ncbi:hypothetical protein [Streptomyces kanamyceticus]|uniref:Uncharacterized protein n=1 Tax=Streptomyces kanamyceticus TaxID=1967 RepID=A0A5J6GE44_STRKN|nr:hypothetical protein [Streptomyces kanamyceticus]QEU93373.1 hypothetical protein CP970_22835 [Streptomyces kanamyceticus]
MNRRRRSPSDLGLELWDLVLDSSETGMPKETALDHMTDNQFQIAKVWDKDEMCPREQKCFLYVYGHYWISDDPRMSVLALNREIELLYRRAARLHRSAIAPLTETGHETPQLRVAHTALAGMIEAAAPLRRAGFSSEVAARDGAEAG